MPTPFMGPQSHKSLPNNHRIPTGTLFFAGGSQLESKRECKIGWNKMLFIYARLGYYSLVGILGEEYDTPTSGCWISLLRRFRTSLLRTQWTRLTLKRFPYSPK